VLRSKANDAHDLIECDILLSKDGRLWIDEIRQEFWNGKDWVEYDDPEEAASALNIPKDTWLKEGIRRLSYFSRETTWPELAHENLAASFSPRHLEIIPNTQPPTNQTSEGVVALINRGWKDLTGGCSTASGARQRLMSDPRGEFQIVSEVLEAGGWRVDIQTATPPRARHFYVTNCIPESLANGFYEWEDPELRLCTNLVEMEALLELMAVYSTDDVIRGRADGQRLKVGLHHLIRHTSERTRDANEAL
jgi:hypothetical protein